MAWPLHSEVHGKFFGLPIGTFDLQHRLEIAFFIPGLPVPARDRNQLSHGNGLLLSGRFRCEDSNVFNDGTCYLHRAT